MKIICQKCNVDVLLLEQTFFTEQKAITKLKGRCEECGQGYVKELPEDIKI